MKPEGEELDVPADLVELYEAKHVPMGMPSPLGAIPFRMEQGGLAPRDLIPLIGSRAKVSEVLSGKRPLTMQRARTGAPNAAAAASDTKDDQSSRRLIGFSFIELPKRSSGSGEHQSCDHQSWT